MNKCKYCGNMGVYQFKNGEWCCSKSKNKCPELRRKNKKGQELNGGVWNKGLTKETDERIKKYGENGKKTIQKQFDNGRKVWNKELTKETDERVKKYGENQKWKKGKVYTLKYFQDLYGKDKGYKEYKKLNELKRPILDNFIGKYGNEGIEKFKDFIEKKKTSFHSKISQELFWSIYNKLNNKENIYFAELNKEYGKILNKKYYFFDFVDDKKKKIIEFNGDYWHANPKIYNRNWFNGIKQKYAKDIWNEDFVKIDNIKKMEYDVLIVWQADYIKNQEEVIKKCINFLLN